ncbi:ATP-binding cassette domain-containing protein [Demequina lutea]|uniref:ABC-type Fe3+/spermidine/putrescine transport system ATPase subunit n=1 Tax=Demequina lutea TaxID=431489 RepID=A0A7Z0CIY6_9MICO|nr:ATP-binding cassette domain-containing protein [Demequina lutea]NYI42464.1 ABC-type Fe3+/spermidine/putrescine transport system ATPase subunit [Demequina lutea]
MVGLAGFGPRDTRDLSGGERQRVALARSLAPSPRLLALDEPPSSLDAELRTRLGAEVRDILRSAGTTFIMVTHDAAEGELVDDRVVLMSDGRLIDA